jgi:hypothetical protein
VEKLRVAHNKLLGVNSMDPSACNRPGTASIAAAASAFIVS